MKAKTINIIIIMLIYAVLVGFFIATLVLRPTYERDGQKKAVKGEWLIYADTISVDTTYVKYRKIKSE